MDDMYFIFMYNKAPTQSFKMYRAPFFRSLGNDCGEQYNLNPKKSLGFGRPPHYSPVLGVIAEGLADLWGWILHCVVAVL